jgi:hypothetical protein
MWHRLLSANMFARFNIDYGFTFCFGPACFSPARVTDCVTSEKNPPSWRVDTIMVTVMVMDAWSVALAIRNDLESVGIAGHSIAILDTHADRWMYCSNDLVRQTATSPLSFSTPTYLSDPAMGDQALFNSSVESNQIIGEAPV